MESPNINKDTSVIPVGLYCYKIKSIDKSTGRLSIDTCPYWDNIEEHGYCHYMECGDGDEDGTILLFDQVKECGINLDDIEH